MRSAFVIAAIAWATFATGAVAAEQAASCQEELVKVKQTYATHKHQKSGKEGINWAQIDSAIKKAEQDCAAGKSREAYEQINLAHRWLGTPQHTKH